MTTGRTFFPCLFLDTALATQQLEAFEGLCLAESWLCLSQHSHSLQPWHCAREQRGSFVPRGSDHQSLLMLAPGHAAFSDVLPAQPLASQISYSALGFSAPQVRRVVFCHGIQRNRSLRTPQRHETKSNVFLKLYTVTSGKVEIKNYKSHLILQQFYCQ